MKFNKLCLVLSLSVLSVAGFYAPIASAKTLELSAPSYSNDIVEARKCTSAKCKKAREVRK